MPADHGNYVPPYQCKQICENNNLRGVIVLAFDFEPGTDRLLCTPMTYAEAVNLRGILHELGCETARNIQEGMDDQ